MNLNITAAVKKVTDSEPALAGATALWILTNLGAFLVSHHVVSSVQWQGLTAQITPYVSAAIIYGIGFAVRHFAWSPKSVAALQSKVDAAQAALAKASTADPVVVNLNGSTLTAVIPNTPDPAPAVTTDGGLPPVTI